MRASVDFDDSSPLLQRPHSASNRAGSVVKNDVESEGVIHNKLGTLNGCYVPCLLNIMGVILFERLAWGVGVAGVGTILFIFLIAEVATFFTVLSLSAMVSNGSMRGGGSYYMISRTLGPEFGGSVGILFYAAYCVGVAFYVTGVAEEFIGTFFPDRVGDEWWTVGVASITLFLCLIIALMGAGWFTKINVALFTLQFGAVLLCLSAIMFRGKFNLNPGKSFVYENVHHEWSVKRFFENFIPHYQNKLPPSSMSNCKGGCSFQLVFGIMFPAVTGIMEGANLSGDLKDPAYSIPVGTVGAVLTSMVFYFLLIIAIAGTFSAETMIGNFVLMQQSTWGHAGTTIVVVGILVSAGSSALGSLFGGSRVLQALARDELFPHMSYFSYGSQKGDEPVVAVLFTWFVAQLITMIGSINAIAPISTSFFCLSYLTVNLSCFLVETSGTPNWRPQFKYFTWHTCLIGVVMNIGMLFYIDMKFGMFAMGLEMIIFVYLAYRAPANSWGDVTQSVMFHQVRKYLLRLDERKAHSKLWRPSILLLADKEEVALVDFCNNLKKGGLYIVGNVIKGEYSKLVATIPNLRKQWIHFVEQHAIKAFPQISIAPNARIGYENLVMLSGLGALQPNILVLPMWKSDRHLKSEDESKEDELLSSDKPATMSELHSLVISKNPHSNGIVYPNNHHLPIYDGIAPEVRNRIVSSPSEMTAVEYIEFLDNVLENEKNVAMTANFEQLDNQLVVSSSLKQHVVPRNIGLNANAGRPQGATNASVTQFVDVWLFSTHYSWSLDERDLDRDHGFPMLLMQFANILLENKVWEKAAGLRIFLAVPDEWTPEQQVKVDEMIRTLRLRVDDIIVVREPDPCEIGWEMLVNVKQERFDKLKTKMIRYYSALSKLIGSLSTQSYFTFLKLPRFPSLHGIADDEESTTRVKLCALYFDCVASLVKHLPPCALVATGERLPSISTDI